MEPHSNFMHTLVLDDLFLFFSVVFVGWGRPDESGSMGCRQARGPKYDRKTLTVCPDLGLSAWFVCF